MFQNQPTPIWQPLRTNTSTRLLILHAASKSINGDGEISATLIEADMSDDPEYEAISWTWGTNVADLKTLFIDGHEILIRNHLWRFMAQLRKSDEDRVLWVDAISINQLDNVEKSQQVAIIGDIFRNAQRVVCWLGEHADGSEGIFSRLLASAAHQPLPSSVPPLTDVEQEARIQSWLSLLRRPWFTRTWIVQEVSLARELILHCGDSAINWKHLPQENGGPWDGITNHVERCRLFFSREDGHDYWLYRLHTQRTVYQGSYPVGRVSEPYFVIENIAPSFSRFQCSDVRDRVYALLSLEKLEMLPSGVMSLKPNYAFNTKEMLVSLFRQRCGCLWSKSRTVRDYYSATRFASELGKLLDIGQGMEVATLLEKEMRDGDDTDIWTATLNELKSVSSFNPELYEATGVENESGLFD